jgi:hypothetical protein
MGVPDEDGGGSENRVDDEAADIVECSDGSELVESTDNLG